MNGKMKSFIKCPCYFWQHFKSYKYSFYIVSVPHKNQGCTGKALKANYQPVSVLPITSINYECSMHDQLSAFMDKQFSPFLAAFRKGFGCQSTLLRMLEDWRRTLDNREWVAAIFMDLSEVFVAFLTVC